jgi:hypothetical protein
LSDNWGEQPKALNPITSRPMVMIEKRFMVVSSFDSRQLTIATVMGSALHALPRIKVLEMRPRRTSQFSQDQLGTQLRLVGT